MKKIIEELTKEEYDNIIDRVFRFAEMNSYYKKDENRLGPNGLAELVIGSPDLNIYEKYEIIKRIAKTVDGDTGEEISNIARDFKEAIDALTLAPGEVLSLREPWYDTEINEIKEDTGFLFTKFEKVMEEIGYLETAYGFQMAMEDDDESETDDSEINVWSLCWPIIEKWVPGREGSMYETYAFWYVYETGICWFERYENPDSNENLSSHSETKYSFECSQLNLAVPFRAGDIVRIDCMPFAPPINALILYSGEDRDCCGVLALYYRKKNRRGEGAYTNGAVKHCDMWMHLFPNVLVSPLYRLRKFTGKLNEKNAVFEKIAAMIKGSNEKGDKVWELTKSGSFTTPEELLEAVQNLQL